MNRTFVLVVLALFSLLACEQTTDTTESKAVEKSKAQEIVDQAMLAHGSANIEGATIEFDFRDKHYTAKRENGLFTYTRSYTDTTAAQIKDVLTNEAFVRTVNGATVELTEKERTAFSSSVNSVVYFVLLPYFLNDAAVNKEYLGETSIKGEPYQKLKVSFREAGGGEDFDDEYIYWIHKQKHTMDYLAYNYQVNGGGARFRVPYNVRTIEGIRFADYYNMKPLEKTLAVATFDSLYMEGGLAEVSKIITENIKVTRN